MKIRSVFGKSTLVAASVMFMTAPFVTAAETQTRVGETTTTAQSGDSQLVATTESVKKTVETTTTQTGKRPKVAIALGGGGMRGAAHVGVLRVLTEAGIPIDYIAGTSMGAIVGGLYSAGVPLDTMEEKFDSRKLMTAFMTIPLWMRMGLAPVIVMPRAFGYHPYDGLYKGNKFRKYLVKSVPESERKIEELKIPFCAVVTNVVTGKEFPLASGSLGYAMQASSAVPGLRKPVEIGSNLYCDGGMVDNVPCNEAKAMGADIVIAVDVDERLNDVPLDTFRKMGSMSKQMLKVQLARIDSFQERSADVVIHPNCDGIGLISTKAADARRAIAEGEKAAREALPAIKAKLASYGMTEASLVPTKASASTVTTEVTSTKVGASSSPAN